MIQELIYSAKMETGQYQAELSEVSLVGLIKDLVSVTNVHLGADRLQYRVKHPVQRILVDRNQLTRLLQNLISNAIRYSLEDSEITIEVGAEGTGVLISVIDKGYGIPPEDLANLFSKYFRANKSMPSSEGLGLGLYISKRIAEAHGGKIWAESTVDEGSSFHVFIPSSQET